MAATGLQVLSDLATDGSRMATLFYYFPLDSLQPLLEEDFDPKGFATGAIQGQTVGELLHKLVTGINELDNELYSQVEVDHISWIKSESILGSYALRGSTLSSDWH